ncbi:hypothetical protein AVEN_86683-1 [Araneus ventricosus]|uniref:Uncharacterized protein n=1 Tax=Araneus ventricosus TaxID=182803 RepID=A0A4Y2KMS5_ARAVE|nr:hypothetical protein AVEN_86683-1 [Araneus ventricosus]
MVRLALDPFLSFLRLVYVRQTCSGFFSLAVGQYSRSCPHVKKTLPPRRMNSNVTPASAGKDTLFRRKKYTLFIIIIALHCVDKNTMLLYLLTAHLYPEH